MKEYPTISAELRYGASVYMLDKLDGSNIRGEWSRKKGFWKFGRRHGLLDHSTPILLRAPDLIKARYEAALAEVFRALRWEKAITFFEFYGPSSFAGQHDEREEQTVTLIGVAGDKKGFVSSRDFVDDFHHVGIPNVVYHGPFSKEIEMQIREGRLPGVTFEGVVCQGPFVSPGMPLMFKVKAYAWLEKLRAYCAGDEKLFLKLQ